MGDSQFRFRLHHLLILIMVVAVFLGGIIWINDQAVKGYHAAVRAAFMDGRMTRQQARNDAGREVDQWPDPPKK